MPSYPFFDLALPALGITVTGRYYPGTPDTREDQGEPADYEIDSITVTEPNTLLHSLERPDPALDICAMIQEALLLG